MRFISRAQAGRLLGERLRGMKVEADLTLGLPRGGVVVAAEVARQLDSSLAALVVRKIGHPHHRELAVGALAEPGIVVFESSSLRWNGPGRGELEAVQAEELQRLRYYQQRFHPAGLPELEGKNIVLVDDGLATGATMEAAVRSARKQKAARILVAVPVASTVAADRIGRLADQVVALITDADFMAVGCYYENFAQVNDAEVEALLLKALV
jgi:predicted phosphoribosyltransferase